MRELLRSRPALGAVAFQGAGSLATFLCTVVVAHAEGPVVQGAFNTLKAELDLLVAALLLGAPQALFFFVQRGLLAWSHAVRISAVQALLGVLLAAFLYFFFVADDVSGNPSSSASLLAGIAVGALLLQNDLRGACLAHRSATTFGMISALPGVSLLLIIVVFTHGLGMSMSRATNAPAMVFCIAYLLAAGAAAWLLLFPRVPIPAAPETSPTFSIPVLLKYGIATWVPAVEQGLALVVALHLIADRVADPAGVGIFSSALLTLVVLLTPLNFLVPLIFKRWIGLDIRARIRELGMGLQLFAVVTPIVALIAWAMEDSLVRTLFGAEFLGKGGVLAILSLSLLPQAVSKLSGVFFNSVGKPSLAAVGESVRLLAVFGMFTWGRLTSVLEFTLVWVAADYLGALIGWSLARLHGARAAI